MTYNPPSAALIPIRTTINHAYLGNEGEAVDALLPLARLNAAEQLQTETQARQLITQVRTAERSLGGVGAMLKEYDLSSQEGVLLMCLAEALLRIPDAATADKLIQDKLSSAEWRSHLGNSSSLFVNASTWGLLLTGQIVKHDDSPSLFSRMVSRSGEPLIRMAIKRAMGLIGDQFVIGATIEQALKRSVDETNRPYRHSFDMLGEAALTHADAARYLAAYQHAIATLGKHTGQGELFDHPGISVKLSALHPRYEHNQHTRVIDELVPNLLTLALAAKAANINMTIDSEEADRLDLSLDIFEILFNDDALSGWNGLGMAVQAYQKRAIHVIDWLAALASQQQRQIPVRLVKGAYWDTEIKQAQERGLSSYPVFTRKIATDVSYRGCARHLLKHEWLYPQFATHNAHSVASIITLAGTRPFEFQRLHGMGETLYSTLLKEMPHLHCRVYAPVGGHKELLPYLVRRLLENGANSSFVNQISNEQVPLETMVTDPVSEVEASHHRHHPDIPAPCHLYGAQRLNSNGINLADKETLQQLESSLQSISTQRWQAAPIIDGKTVSGATSQTILNPANHNDIVGEITLADGAAADKALDIACKAAPDWSKSSASGRAELLEKAADLLEEGRIELMSLIIREGGRTIPDSLNEVREAIDFFRYYAAQVRQKFDQPIHLPGVTGENNQLRLAGRGVFICISPWNFPAAIFAGQVAAALAAGNCVIAKPAAATPLCAAYVVRLLHKAGIPQEVLHFVPGSGSEVGMKLVSDPRIAGVAFTGSSDTARTINQALAQGPRIVPFIAETGGQNCMIVDSSALAEQVVKDVIGSAFNSAGQRCSALRVLFLQQEIAPHIIEMLKGAMDELQLGNPIHMHTDIGPVINTSTRNGLQKHADRMEKEARHIKTVKLPEDSEQGSYFAPRVYEISSLDQLQHEVFGPILHNIQYPSSKLNEVVEAINNSGYGLTLGIHSRINSTIDYITQHSRCGNTYVNRNMIGAVVESQPFGGEGLSGSGPKAGGPHYLQRFATERVLTVNTAAVGGNALLLAIAATD